MSSVRSYKENVVSVKKRDQKHSNKGRKKETMAAVSDLSLFAHILPHYPHRNQRLFLRNEGFKCFG
jgi:hypothetical protein